MNEDVAKILGLIEQARIEGKLGSDQARAASVALTLEGDDALLACRLIAQGSDPASLDYLDAGEIDPGIMAAHLNGPGAYKIDDPRLSDYLGLCALSADESHVGEATVRGRFWGFFRAMTRLSGSDEEFKNAALKQLGKNERQSILGLPYSVAVVGGRSMRVYRSDRGFAAAAWDGESCAAVLGAYDGKPYLSVGSPPYCLTLEKLGVKVDKALSPRFGIVDGEAEVARVIGEIGTNVG